jgi:pimeloyl-ACP methyl ester carboxylesterase
MNIDRNFVRIDEGQVHFRNTGFDFKGKKTPLYMIHASPSSSINLTPLMHELSSHFYIIAPDTLGFGDSPPPKQDIPNAEDYAESVIRIMDALDITKCHFYGSHTGAHIACEVAINYPDRVDKLIFDGIGMFSDEDKKDFLENYAPEVIPDEFGQHLIWAWNFVRDQVLHFPYFRRTPEFRRNNEIMPKPDDVQKVVLEVLKGLTTYHKGYRAAFRHPDKERLPLIRHKTFCGASDDDPLKSGINNAASLIKNASKGIFPSERSVTGLQNKAKQILKFIEEN